MSVSNIFEISRENGQLISLDGKFGIIQRPRDAGTVKVSVYEFMQEDISPVIGLTYCYTIYENCNKELRAKKINHIMRVVRNERPVVVDCVEVFVEKIFSPNACIEWYDWQKGFGAVLMMAEGDCKRTAFLHNSVLTDALDEYGLPEGIQLSAQKVHVVVVLDPLKDLRVVKLKFV